MRIWLLSIALLVALPAAGQQVQRQQGVTISNLTNAERTLLPALPRRIIQFCVLVGGAAAETVIARAIDDSPVYATIALAAGETKVVAISTPVTEEGLEVGTTNPAGDVSVSCLYSILN